MEQERFEHARMVLVRKNADERDFLLFGIIKVEAFSQLSRRVGVMRAVENEPAYALLPSGERDALKAAHDRALGNVKPALVQLFYRRCRNGGVAELARAGHQAHPSPAQAGELPAAAKGEKFERLDKFAVAARLSRRPSYRLFAGSFLPQGDGGAAGGEHTRLGARDLLYRPAQKSRVVEGYRSEREQRLLPAHVGGVVLAAHARLDNGDPATFEHEPKIRRRRFRLKARGAG